jgi:Zn finger protein HypA/HybF involved in hydrogenase expression
MRIKCKKCKYKWNSRINKPKECPRCKTRMDTIYHVQEVQSKTKFTGDTENEKRRSDKKSI